MKFNITDNKKFSEISGDNNKIHINKKHAKKFFIKKPIVHGVNILIKAFKKKKFLKNKFNYLEIVFKDFVNIDEKISECLNNNYLFIKGLYNSKIEIYKNFNENKIGLAYARSLGKKVDIGVQFNYYGYNVPSYSNASAIFFEAGAIIHFTDDFNGGIHIYNPVGGKLNNVDKEKLASAYKMGFGYDASDNFFISADIVKEEDKPINVVAGLQYNFAKQFFARAGFMSESGTAFTGLGVAWKNFRLDVAGSYHPQLGFSPGIMLLTNFGKEKTSQ